MKQPPPHRETTVVPTEFIGAWKRIPLPRSCHHYITLAGKNKYREKRFSHYTIAHARFSTRFALAIVISDDSSNGFTSKLTTGGFSVFR